MRVVVVGAGIAGIASAIVAADQGHDVTLVESSSRPGGLLKSVELQGQFFDYGTHIPRETGDPYLDALLFSGMQEPSWVELKRVDAGAFFAGRLWEKSEFPSVHALGDDVAQRAWAELKAIEPPSHEFADLEQQLLGTFGSTITRRVFEPAMKKFLGVDLGQLSVDTHRLFLSRVIAGSPLETTRLKVSDPSWDARLGFHTANQHQSTKRSWYPATDGVGLWIDDLVANQVHPSTLLLGARASRLRMAGDQITEVVLEHGESLACDAVVWTVGVEPFLRASQLLRNRLEAPTLRGTTLVHVVTTEPVQTSVHYATVFDPEPEVFRVTFYDNLRSRSTRPGEYSLTLEYLGGQHGVGPSNLTKVRADLEDMGLIRGSADVTVVGSENVRYGFPVPTPAFHALVRDLMEEASQVKNVAFAGKGTGRTFFLTDVLLEIPSIVKSVV